MSEAIRRLDPATFDYTKFELDLRKRVTRENLSMRDVSTKILFRSETYLAGIFKKKNMPVNVLFALCARFGFKAKDYEINPEPPKPELKPEAQVPAPAPKPAAPSCILKNGWDSVIRVNEDARTVSIRIFHDGSQVTSAMAKLRGDSDLDVVQSISYAAHMCYKFAEQKDLGARTGG